MKGAKPDFHDAMPGEKAQILYQYFLESLKQKYHKERVFPGAFGQYMNIEMVGDGPVTISLDFDASEKEKAQFEQKKKRT